jgi:hypothetical protein
VRLSLGAHLKTKEAANLGYLHLKTTADALPAPQSSFFVTDGAESALWVQNISIDHSITDWTGGHGFLAGRLPPNLLIGAEHLFAIPLHFMAIFLFFHLTPHCHQAFKLFI